MKNVRTVSLDRPSQASADQSKIKDWVSNRKTPEVPKKMKRISLDIPADLHVRTKMKCAELGITISDVIRDLLSKKFG